MDDVANMVYCGLQALGYLFLVWLVVTIWVLADAGQAESRREPEKASGEELFAKSSSPDPSAKTPMYW